MSFEPPLVTIVIPTYNYAHFLCDAIDSAFSQLYKNIEVIVVDDGSSDNTSEVIKKYGSKMHYIHQTNRGLSAARNTGILASQGEYIAFLDADDIWLPDKLAKQIGFLTTHESFAAVSCLFDEVNHDLTLKSQNKFPIDKLENFQDCLILGNCFGGGSQVVVTKKCFDLVGCFDEALNSSEDWDMWLRISKEFPIKVLNEVLLKVRVGSYNMSSAGNAQKMLNNELVVLDKYFGKQLAPSKCRALSQRYFCASWAFMTSGNLQKAWVYLFKAVLFNPVFICSKNFWGMLIALLKKRKV